MGGKRDSEEMHRQMGENCTCFGLREHLFGLLPASFATVEGGESDGSYDQIVAGHAQCIEAALGGLVRSTRRRGAAYDRDEMLDNVDHTYSK